MGLNNNARPHKNRQVRNAFSQRQETGNLIRLLYLAYYIATGIIEPFMPIYFSSLGYGGQIIGILGSITPITTFVVGPLWGILSDRSGNPFSILYITILVSVVCQSLIGISEDFYTVVVVVALRSVFIAPVKSLIDSLVLQQLGDRSEYGKMKLWSILGSGISTLLSGIFVSNRSFTPSIDWKWPSTLDEFLTLAYANMTGYRLLFLAHLLLHIPVFLTLRYFEKTIRNPQLKPDQSRQSNENSSSVMSFVAVFSEVFKKGEHVLFFAMVFMIGVAGGLADNFTYVRFREVGGTGANMGLSRFLSSIGGAVMFYYAKALASMLGTPKVVVLSLITISIRFALVATMTSPTQGYIAEFLRGASYGTFWSTATVFVSQILPNQADATMIQLLNIFYNGVGRSVGALVGGKIQTSLGTSDTFGVSAIVYFMLAFFYFTIERQAFSRPETVQTKVHTQ